MRWTIRRATVADAERVARINVDGWSVAYRGILADDYLDSMRPGDRVDRITEQLAAGQRVTFLAVDEAGTIGAYAGATPARDPGDEQPGARTGELAALYADPGLRGTGAGGAVHRAGLEHLATQGFQWAVLWVFEENEPARRFYHEHGWSCDGTRKQATLGGRRVSEIRYSRPLRAAQPAST